MANVIILGSKKSLSLLRPVPLETENLTGAGNNKPETIVGSNLEYINLKLKLDQALLVMSDPLHWKLW